MLTPATDAPEPTHPVASVQRRLRSWSRVALLAVIPLACVLMAPRCFSTHQLTGLPKYHGTVNGHGACTPFPIRSIRVSS